MKPQKEQQNINIRNKEHNLITRSIKKVAIHTTINRSYRIHVSHQKCYPLYGSLKNIFKASINIPLIFSFVGNTCARVSFLINLQVSGLQLY